MSKLQVIPFTNNLGQILNPGDSVLYFAEGFKHRHFVRTGVYRGVIVGTDRYNRGIFKVSILANMQVGEWVYASDHTKKAQDPAYGNSSKKIIWKKDFAVQQKIVTLTSNRAYLLA